MPGAGAPFEVRGGWVLRALMRDLDLVMNAAGGLVGNTGFESGGFTKLREIGQPEGRGGYGWGQWTADRRVTFLAYSTHHGLAWRSDEANYGYLLEELRGAYRGTVAALRRLGPNVTLAAAVWSVGQTYERPGGTAPDNLPGFEGRLHYAQRALAGAQAAPGRPPAIIHPAANPVDYLDVQRRLNAWGIDPALVEDGWLGPNTADAIQVFQGEAKLPATGLPDNATLAALRAASA